MIQNLLQKTYKVLDSRLVSGLFTPPTPPLPQEEKVKVFERFAKDFDLPVFIETGTYKGATINALRDVFKKIISIELDETLYREAVQRFSNMPHITILQGDSGIVLEKILSTLNEPALFWLDGHYSGDGTAKGDEDTPIVQELESILKHSIKNHVILIDDARFFIGQDGYPTIKRLKKVISNFNPVSHMSIEGDIIRIFPKSSTQAISLHTQNSYYNSWRNKFVWFYLRSKKSIKRFFGHEN